MRRVSGCTLCTLYFVNSGEVASDEMLLITLLLMSLLLMMCLQEHFLQTRFFTRISFNKIPLLFDLFNQNLYEYYFDYDPVHLKKCLAYPIEKHPLFQQLSDLVVLILVVLSKQYIFFLIQSTHWF